MIIKDLQSSYLSNLPKVSEETKIVVLWWLSTKARRFEDVHERNQRNDNERYFAKRRSMGDEREECVVVDIIVGNKEDNSSVDKR